MLYEYELEVGLICYWQIRGWHGRVVIERINSRFIYYRVYEGDLKVSDKIYRKARKKFLEEHKTHDCEYDYGDVGKILCYDDENKRWFVK